MTNYQLLICQESIRQARNCKLDRKYYVTTTDSIEVLNTFALAEIDLWSVLPVRSQPVRSQ